MLSRDPSCMRDMLWRIHVDRSTDLVGLAARLMAGGWHERSRIPTIRHLEGPSGHCLVLIPRTGRVQIRVHYLTPKQERVEAAQALHARVLGLLDDLG